MPARLACPPGGPTTWRRLARRRSWLLAVLALTGCTMQTFHLHSGDAPDPDTLTQVVETQNFFVGGVGQELALNAAAACVRGERVVAVEVHRSLINVLLSYASFGFYTPAQAVVHCR